MTVRERFDAALDGRPVDRLPVIEWADWWDQTLARWRSEGLPDGLDRYDVCRHFGLDVWFQVWTCTVHWDCPYREPSHGAGRMATAPSLDAVEPYIGRWPLFADEFRKGFAWQEAGEALVWFTFPGFFWGPREVLGVERHLLAFYDEPEWIHRINERLADWMIGYLRELDALGRPAFVTFAEDLSYNHGPMLSEAAFHEFLTPYYRRVVPELRERGIRVFLDSDGDVSSCAAWFLEAGLEGVLPLERQAGVDVLALRKSHPDLGLVGGFDKLVMSQGPEAIAAEFERLRPAVETGGFLPSCDHQTPPAVSLVQYQEYLRQFRAFAASFGS